jgi:hypothetical protein
MLRFFATCVLLAAGCAAVIIYASEIGGWINKPEPKPEQKQAGEGKAAPGRADSDEAPAAASPAGSRAPDAPVRITSSTDAGSAMPLVIQDGRVMPLERREVPSERDGKLSLLATPVPDGEFVPPDKLETVRINVLGVQWKDGDEKLIAREREYNRRPAIREPFTDPDAAGPNAQKLYRLPLQGDNFEPGTTRIIGLRVRFRKLAEDDEVEQGQLIGVINPAVALEELAIKRAKVDAAAAEVIASRALKEESQRRYDAMKKARQRVPGAVSDDDFFAGKVTIDRYASEEVAKMSAVEQAKQELSGAWTTLDLYFIRAPIPGRIRTIYRQQGEAVKNLESVLQLHNTRRLRVEAPVEVQDALPLQARVRRAEEMRHEAKRLERTNPKEAAEQRRLADELTRVKVEITRPVSPMAVLQGHHQEVTCVGVTADPVPRIVSGSEDGFVRVWERVPGEERWHEKLTINHQAPVRALACAGGKLLTATSRGQVRIFDLAGLSTRSEPTLCGAGDEKARHQGAVTTIAVNADGTRAATAGEDRSIIFWNLPSGERAGVIKNAHNNSITWVGFTPAGKLLSSGRDKAMHFWEEKDGRWQREEDNFPTRSNDVATLSLSPKTNALVIDVDRELRVLTLGDNHKLVGSLVNPGAAGAFSHMALFSPDGQTILTGGNGPGRLQLWRAPSRENRAAELRQFLWTTGTAICGAFDPKGEYAVTGTTDHRVLVWRMPAKDEAARPSDGQLTYVDENLDSGLKRVTVRATITDAPQGVNPGSSATIVVPPRGR